MKWITVSELKEMMAQNPSLQVIDVREEYEYQICNIGCKNMPMGDIAENIDDLDNSEELIVLCKSGRRAEAVANLLATDFGFENVSIVEGGIMAWAENIDNSLETY